jgi:hypothetical protein
VNEQSTRAVGEAPFEPEDFAHMAKMLRKYDRGTKFYAICRDNLNIILSALDAASEDCG